jgi:hypothetical protein
MRKLTIVFSAIGLMLVFQTAIYADFIAKAATVHTSTGGATTAPDVDLINGHTSLGALYLNNLTTNSFPFGGAASAVAVGSNILASYGARTGGGPTPLYNGLPVVAVFAFSGSTTSGPGPIFRATGGRVGLFTIGALSTYRQFDPTTWGATNATGTALLSPIAVWDLKPAESVFDPGDVPGGGGQGFFNLGTAKVNQISLNTTVATADQGFFVLRESTTYSGTTLSGNSFISVTGNVPIVPPGSTLIDEGFVSRSDGSRLVATTTNTAAVSGASGLAALNTIANNLGGIGLPGSAFATGFGGIGNAAGPGTNFNPSSGAKAPNTADGIYTFGVTVSPGVQIPATASSLLSDLLDAVTGVGPGSSLADKIQAAINALQVNNNGAACSSLNAFVNEVQAQSGKKLTVAQANQFIAAADNIKALLGC